eukprot:2363169-Rhodomonas_salina.1
MLLRSSYGMCGTEIGYAATRKGALGQQGTAPLRDIRCCAVCCTDLAYRAKLTCDQAVLAWRNVRVTWDNVRPGGGKPFSLMTAAEKREMRLGKKAAQRQTCTSTFTCAQPSCARYYQGGPARCGPLTTGLLLHNTYEE